ncbi:MAG: hypothetical protein KF861_03095 [Planctomycetaceae bacterium]|nr:hypothetical protein [Planctomycetaceae bacterium]
MDAQARHFLLVSLLCCCTLSHAICGEPDEVIPFERILSRDAVVDADRLLNDLVQSDFELSSLTGGRHGFFECYLNGDRPTDEPQIHRTILDDDGERRVQVLSTNDSLPNIVTIDRVILIVGRSSNRWEQRLIRGFTCQVDEDHLFTYSDPAGVPPEVESGGYIRFRLASFLRGLIGKQLKSTEWRAATQTLVITRSSGGRILVRFRTPDDQRRLGTLLGGIHLRSSKGADVLFHSFIVDRSSPLRLNFDDVESLPARLGAIDGTKSPTTVGLPYITTREGLQEVRKLESEILLLCDDSREIGNPDFNTRFEELINGLAHAFEEGIRPTLSSGRRFRGLDAYVSAFVSELETAYLAIQRAITEDDPNADPIVDDPNILWLGFERGLKPRMARLIFCDELIGLLVSDQVSLPEKIKLCIAFGEFGPPPWAVSGMGSLGPDGPLLEAILHARWGWMPTEEELALCMAKVKEEWPRPLEQEAAIDSLIRWGHLNDVPPAALEDWFLAKQSASPAHRHCTWKALTRTPEGRAFLLSKLDALAATPEVQREVADIFCHRARATLAMERFDFMSRDECETSLKLCEPLIERPAA